MIYFIGFLLYLVFGFTLIGFLLARDKNDDSVCLWEYVFMSLAWPFFLMVYMQYSVGKLHNVIPYLRKVFGGPKKN